MADIIHTFEHNWEPVSPYADWTLPAAAAARFGMTVNPGETAKVTKYCLDCDLLQAKVFDAAGEPLLGLRANALIHGIDLFGR